MNEYLQTLQQTFAHDIPITQHMGITVESYNDQGLILKALLAGNTNPKGTAFAGSINALLTLAGWGQTWLILMELDTIGDIVIQDSSISYLRPVSDDFTAICHKPHQDDIAKLAQTLRRKSQARIELRAEIYHNDRIAVEFKGRYVVHLR
jgi:thioesterase domain-containing protein